MKTVTAMKVLYSIIHPNGGSYLCKDGAFVMGYVTGMGKKDTVTYKSKLVAQKKVDKIISRSGGKFVPTIGVGFF